ncbi:MAG: hypothetical protein A49_01580 [Methyloceanibacter sp.]|nr:MAG: hypothetical protein A49_01580 [Methyloceanibacter sp.]
MDHTSSLELRVNFDRELHELIVLVSQDAKEELVEQKLKDMLARYGPHKQLLSNEGYGLLYDVEHLLMGINHKEEILRDYFEDRFKHRDPGS